MKGFKNTTRTMSGHGFAAGGTVGGVSDFRSNLHGSSSVRREVPSSVEDAETGGKTPLRPGYAKGGKAKHFHVHKHYHSGGKVSTKSKSYASAERAAEHETEGAGPMMAQGGHIHDDTSIPADYPDYAKGGRWIAGATKNKGALHRALHVPEEQKIPAKKLAKAAHSQNPTMRKRAALAKTLGKMHHATGGTINRMNAGGALYDDGGSVSPQTQAQAAALAQALMRQQMAQPTPPPPGARMAATGGTINPMATGGTLNRLAPGGQPMMAGMQHAMPARMAAPQVGALGQLAARGQGAPLRRAMPMPGRAAPGPMGGMMPMARAHGGGMAKPPGKR